MRRIVLWSWVFLGGAWWGWLVAMVAGGMSMIVVACELRTDVFAASHASTLYVFRGR
ncbi:hypothetical protein B0I35DRAFT_433494 [Stachybotrys elegans]|uniref:Uncharacterized protein n=1 Tax=Stachybotrys elegans TaxID=80388 RepID=A0A8K0SPT4_9HYPO|nr:hypothetical protein B0I35DRAFT_433494 [Stachybotrys elegans]